MKNNEIEQLWDALIKAGAMKDGYDACLEKWLERRYGIRNAEKLHQGDAKEAMGILQSWLSSITKQKKKQTKSETFILKSVLKKYGARAGLRLFRNETAGAWVGKAVRLKDGSVKIQNPRFIRSGLCTGSSDLVGWVEKTITPDMVGQKLAVFVAIETKAAKGKVTPEQVNFLKAVKDAGGNAVIAWNADHVEEIFQ